MRLAPLIALTALAAPGAGQTYTLLAHESFDYAAGDLHGNDGGAFWFEPWFAGPGHAQVSAPGLDGAGGKATTVANDGGCYRKVSTLGWDHVTFGGRFGVDHTTLWVSFDLQRASDASYGGLSLHEVFVGEKLFLGSPFGTGELGVDYPGSPGPVTVAGSSPDAAHRLVYRVDFLPGMERVRLWLDPPVPHPLTAPDLDTQVADLLFNEIRLQSGGGTVSYHFDDVRLELQDAERPSLVVDTETLSVSNGGTQHLFYFAPEALAGGVHVLLGSASGTSPGTPVDGVTLPLNLDPYMLFVLEKANGAVFGDTIGVLDKHGHAVSTITIPAGSDPALAGATLQHAYVVFGGPAFTAQFASLPVPLGLTD